MQQPRLWLLVGPRHGDNAQLRALAADLGWPAEEIAPAYNPLRRIPNVLLGASRLSLAGNPDGLVPPWPDALIAIGRRPVPLARWIARRSGGRTRLVHLGRPRVGLRHFDLVLTTPQYAMPDSPNLVRLSMPWQSPLSEPPACGRGAHVLAILGGPSRSASLPETIVDTLAERALLLARSLGLPVVATTAPRTPRALVVRLRQRLGAGTRLYDWAAASGRANPYRADLALAAEIVITGDSVSTLADAAWTNRPVTVIVPPAPRWLRMIDRFGGLAGRLWRQRGGNFGLGTSPPDLDAVRVVLIAHGFAHEAGSNAWRLSPCREALEAERHTALARLRAVVQPVCSQ
jgi:mitochondrial fission protein ELM1